MKAVEFQGVQRLSPFQGWCVKMSRNTLKMPRNDGKFARVVARVKSAGPGPGWKSAAFPAKFTGREREKTGPITPPVQLPVQIHPDSGSFLNGEAFIFSRPCADRGAVGNDRCNGHAEKQMASPQAAWLRGKWSIGHFPAGFCPAFTPALRQPARHVLPSPVSYSAMKSPNDHFPCIHKVSKLVI